MGGEGIRGLEVWRKRNGEGACYCCDGERRRRKTKGMLRLISGHGKLECGG